jgi:hypothetical protein
MLNGPATGLDTAGAQVLSDGDVQLRLNFIEERLDDGRQHASYWQNGWTGFYTAAATAQTIMSFDADNNDDRVNAAVGAVKSAAALIDILLRPMPGRHGADEITHLPTERRLTKGEELLTETASRARERASWKSHIKVIGVNILGGAVIAAFGDESDAAVSTALGIAIGETAIWTQPSQPITNYEKYHQRFPGNHASIIKRWQLVPMANGAMLRIAF